jgi:hypothetical protein
VQLNLGSSAYWRKISISAPNGREIFEIETSTSLKLQGIADLFFESDEPNLDEGVEESILHRFPCWKLLLQVLHMLNVYF